MKSQIDTSKKIRINFLDHQTLDKLYLMVFPDGSMIIPSGSSYLSFGPFLDVRDYEYALDASQFDSLKHLRHSKGWEKEPAPTGKVLNAGVFEMT